MSESVDNTGLEKKGDLWLPISDAKKDDISVNLEFGIKGEESLHVNVDAIRRVCDIVGINNFDLESGKGDSVQFVTTGSTEATKADVWSDAAVDLNTGAMGKEVLALAEARKTDPSRILAFMLNKRIRTALNSVGFEQAVALDCPNQDVITIGSLCKSF